MEIITGRLSGDAQVKTLKDKREVVAFTIALNDHYKTKDGERKKITNFVNCSYWISTKVAERLKKGCIVSLFGHIGLNAYKDISGDFHAFLTFHVNNIKILAYPKKVNAVSDTAPQEEKEDLPF